MQEVWGKGRGEPLALLWYVDLFYMGLIGENLDFGMV